MGDVPPFNSPVLERLFARERARFTPALERRVFAAGDTLCAPGAPLPGLFLILSGQVAVSRPTPGHAFLPLEIVHRGDVVGTQVAEDAPPGEPPPAEAPPSPVLARAITAVSALLLPWDRFVALQRAAPEVSAAVEAFTEIQRHKRAFLAALRRALPLRAASPRRLAQLFDAAETASAEPGATIVAQGDPPSGFHFVLDGELSATRLRAIAHPLHAGDLFGDQAILSGAEPSTVIAETAARLLRIPAQRFLDLLGQSSSFRRSAGRLSAPAPGEPAPAPGAVEAAPEAPHTVEVFLLQSDVPDAPLGILSDLLARTLAEELEDDVAVLELAAPAPGERADGAPRPERDPELPRLARLRVPVPDGPAAADHVEAAIAALGGAFEYVFLDASSRPPAFAAALAPVLSEREGRRLDNLPLASGKVVFLSRDPLAMRLPEPLRAAPIAFAALLDEATRAPEPGRGLAERLRLLGAPLLLEGAPRARAYPCATARVRLRLDRIGRLVRPEDRRRAALPPETVATLSRWARAITDRTVGIALGGGGAWGFAHVTLIRAMHAARVPIDMVSGSSFGALCGAFYCAAGLDGLDLFVREGAAANAAIRASLLSSAAITRFVDERLGHRRLEELEVPLFPVATDLANGTEYVMSLGTLGAGVRASGAFPPMFTPVTGGGMYVVDGGFVNNVPASVLVTEGADLVVASNIVAAPPPMTPSEPLFGGAVGRLLHEFNPLARPLDLMRAGFVLMHTAGQRESEFAHVAFESDPVRLPPERRRTLRDRVLFGRVPFWDFTVGPDVAAQAEPKARATAEQIKAKWDQLSRGARTLIRARAAAAPAPGGT